MIAGCDEATSQREHEWDPISRSLVIVEEAVSGLGILLDVVRDSVGCQDALEPVRGTMLRSIPTPIARHDGACSRQEGNTILGRATAVIDT